VDSLNWLEKLCFVHGLYDEKFLHPTPMDPRDQARRANHFGAIPGRRVHHIPSSNTPRGQTWYLRKQAVPGLL